MSWLVRSLASLTAADDDGEDGGGGGERRSGGTTETLAPSTAGEGEEGSGTVNWARGVQEDLSELTQTVTRQLWGVASFLAPPPPSPPSAAAESLPSDPTIPLETRVAMTYGESEYAQVVDSPRMAGFRTDFPEIGGRFRSGISMLSKNKAVTEISKIASSFLQFGSDGDEEEDEYGGGDRSAVGATEEVLMFVRNVSMHRETWLDLPLFPDDEDAEDFDMTDAQREHALAVEQLVPRLADLRIELCPRHMSEECFWKIYFVLLHPRLNKHDAELLSTAQIVEAREILSQKLQDRTKPAADSSIDGVSLEKEDNSHAEHIATVNTLCENMPHERAISEEKFLRTDSQTEKHTEIKIVDNSVIEEEVPAKSGGIPNDALKASNGEYEGDGDGWLEEETTESVYPRITSISIGNEEDVSFSDLEEDEGRTSACSKAVTEINSQVEDPEVWIQLGKNDRKSTSPKTEESNEWLDLDDVDVI